MQLGELKELLKRFHIRPQREMGQNFLLSEKVLDEIIAAAELKNTDTVLEIGPGLGVLTKRLAEKAGRVIAVEKDRQLARALRKMFKNRKNIKIVNEDALFMTDPNLRITPEFTESPFPSPSHQGRGTNSGHSDEDSRRSGRFKVVANIPYYITGKLLQQLLSHSPRQITGVPSPEQGEGNKEDLFRPSLIVLLLQKEVAERIVAKPGKMSVLAVSVQFYADAEIVSHVGRENFYPKPDVDSAIVRLRVLDKPRFTPPLIPPHQGEGNTKRFLPLEGRGEVGVIDEKKFFQLVKIGFGNKRKQLQNNLSVLPSLRGGNPTKQSLEIATASTPRDDRPADYKQILSSIGLNPLCRAQDLSLEDWEKLFDKLA